MPILYQKQEKRNGSLAGKKQTSGSSTEPIYGGTQTVYGLKTTEVSSKSKRNLKLDLASPVTPPNRINVRFRALISKFVIITTEQTSGQFP